MSKTNIDVTPISSSKLAEYLRAAEQAHAVYEREQLQGVRDENWADWYAKYIADRLKRDRDV